MKNIIRFIAHTMLKTLFKSYAVPLALIISVSTGSTMMLAQLSGDYTDQLLSSSPENVIPKMGAYRQNIDSMQESQNSVSSLMIAESQGYNYYYSDLIKVEPGQLLEGELYTKREVDTPALGNIYMGIERYDRNKKPIARNKGTNYFVALKQTVPSNGEWTRFSGRTIVPEKHLPYEGSDGQGVHYVRVRVLVNHDAGGGLTQWGGIGLYIRDAQASIFQDDPRNIIHGFHRFHIDDLKPATDIPSSYSVTSDSYNYYYSDFIQVEPGQLLEGEVYAKREVGEGSEGNFYFGIERYDRNKKPISRNKGTEYFAALKQTVPSNGQWTKYVNSIIIPRSHPSYEGSDGQGVHYVRVRVLVNHYPTGSTTQWGGLGLFVKQNNAHVVNLNTENLIKSYQHRRTDALQKLSATDANTVSATHAFSSRVYNYYISDYIAVTPGQALRGEMYAKREVGADQRGAVFFGIERYDKNMKPLSRNKGTTYFAALKQTVPSNGEWTQYAGTTVIPESHAPYQGSDGQGVHYVRVRAIVNHPAQGGETLWSGLGLYPHNDPSPPVSADTLFIDVTNAQSLLFTPNTSDAVLANVTFNGKQNRPLDVRHLAVALQIQNAEQGALSDATNETDDEVHEILNNVELRNTKTGRTERANRLTVPGASGQTSKGTYQIYTFKDIIVRDDTWELRVDFTSNGLSKHPMTGDRIRAIVCAVGTHVNEVPNTNGCNFKALIQESLTYNTEVQDLETGDIVNVEPGENLAGVFHGIERASLMVSEKFIGTSESVAPGSNNVHIASFEAKAGRAADVLLTSISYVAAHGETDDEQVDVLRSAQNYTLWVDTNGDNAVDTIIDDVVGQQASQVRFNSLTDGGEGYVLPRNTSVLFEVHADIVQHPLASKFSVKISPTITAEALHNGVPVESIFLVEANPKTFLFSHANLFITPSTQDRPHQLLAGDRGDSVLNLEFRAEGAPVVVEEFRITSMGNTAQSVDRLELFIAGQAIPFAFAATCPSSKNTLTTYEDKNVKTFCASMPSNQLVIAEGQAVNVAVRPKIKRESDGAIAQDVQFFLNNVVLEDVEAIGVGSVLAKVRDSGKVLSQNNGDTIANGEVFIGLSSANGSENTRIVGQENQVVMSKISSIVHANASTNSRSVPTGVARIGEFTLSAAVNNNSSNGLNDVLLSDIILTVEAKNVTISGTSFTLANKSDQLIEHACSVRDSTNQPLTDAELTGTFYVMCSNMDEAAIADLIEINSGETETFFLSAEVLNPKVEETESTLQVRLENFNNKALNGAFGVGQSHVQWIDSDAAKSKAYQWIEYPESVVRSILFKD